MRFHSQDVIWDPNLLHFFVPRCDDYHETISLTQRFSNEKSENKYPLEWLACKAKHKLNI
ncbi:CLUMA_CG001716, isoform A [Clunio marinus]|uniref:CLUMA_CG001716, isoform A n=1 Tax=Clunio marinus TaxID=568069 RepID=A0A1J1HK60_9DIPT|nr:CLUMA_CG001716, isoform A [Clunio marinus]